MHRHLFLRLLVTSAASAIAAGCGSSTATPPRDAATACFSPSRDAQRAAEPTPAVDVSYPTEPSGRKPWSVASEPYHLRSIEVAPRIQLAAVVDWKRRYPFAAGGLGEWVAQYPDAAALLFQGDAVDPERVEALTDWAVTSPDEHVTSYLLVHGGWDFMQPLLSSRHAAGLDAYLAWCRKSPRAARELAHHAHGLAWAGSHLYAHELGERAAMLGPVTP